jgi:hypothetical protein
MLNPLLLWFLPLAVLPVLLHLLNLHRLREVDLPTFRFLMEGYVQQRRRVRLVEWLLMLLRTAVVLALVWAFSRPVLERFGGLFGGGGRDVVLVVDAGMTSGLISEGTSAIHRIREAVRSAASRFRPTDFVTLVRAGMEPKVLSRAAVGDGKRLAAEIDTLEPDPGTADLAAGLAEAISGPPRGPRSIWIISDCERRAWRRLAEDPATARIPDSVQLVVVDVGSRGRVTNLAILGDPPRAQRPVVGLPVELTLRIEGAGLDTATETKATVELDDEIVAQVPIVVTPGRVTTSTVAIHPPRPGVLRGRVSLPADAFPEDDSLLFVLNVEPRLGVLVIAPAGVEPIYDPGLFLRAALDSPRESVAATRRAANDTPGRSDIAGSLDVVVTRANAFDERQVKAADVIVLADTRIDGGRQRWLRSRVEAGAGLLVLAGSHIRSPQKLAEFASGTDPRGGIGISLGEPVGDPTDESSSHGLGPIDYSHPIFAAFRPAQESAPGGNATSRGSVFDTLQIFRHAAVDIKASERQAARPVVLARLDDQTPILVEARLGRGRVIVSGLAVTPDWSNLPVHPAFVPLMLRAVQHVRPEPPAMAAESVHPYDPAPVRLQDAWRRAVVQATSPSGGRRAIDTVAGDDGVTGALDDTRAVGFYEFDIEPPAGQTAAPLRLGMAVNRDVETAAFEPLAPAEVTATFAPHAATLLTSTAEDPTLHTQLTGRREIWRWLIAAVFGLFVLEFLLSTLRPPAPAGTTETPRGWRARLSDWLGRAVGNAAESHAAG